MSASGKLAYGTKRPMWGREAAIEPIKGECPDSAVCVDQHHEVGIGASRRRKAAWSPL